MGGVLSFFFGSSGAMPSCAHSDWHCFAIVSFVSFLLTVGFAAFWRWLKNRNAGEVKKQPLDSGEPQWTKLNCAQAAVENAANLGSFLLYLCAISKPSYYEELCRSWWDDGTQQMDTALNVLFLVFMLRRLWKADNKVCAVMSCESLIDFITIPQSFYAAFMQRTWIGLRFLRITRFQFYLIKCPKFENCRCLRVLVTIAKFMQFVFVASGFIHLFENNVDPITYISTDRPISYWNTVHLVLMTVSTVGTSEYHAHSTFGRMATNALVLGGIGMFMCYCLQMRNATCCSVGTCGAGNRKVVVAGDFSAADVRAFKESYDGQSGQVILLQRERKPERGFEDKYGHHFEGAQYTYGSTV